MRAPLRHITGQQCSVAANVTYRAPTTLWLTSYCSAVSAMYARSPSDGMPLHACLLRCCHATCVLVHELVMPQPVR